MFVLLTLTRATVLLLCVLHSLPAPGELHSLQEWDMDAMHLAERHGYPSEQHQVVTEDGYLLTLHRIPRGRRTPSATLGPPVLLQHGLLCASDVWLMTPPDKSLAFILADQGYDVWLGNVRGNFYSRAHLNMSAEQPAFWDFSFHEHGVFDLAAMMDYVLKTSSQADMFYLGYSMGATMYYVLMAQRPQYSTRVKLMVAMAPAVFIGHKKMLGLRLIIPFRDAISRLLDLLGVREFLPRTEIVSRVAEHCSDNSSMQPLCLALYVFLFGDDLPQLNKTALPIYSSRLLSGCSKKTLMHYIQIAATGRFQQYDYGPEGNLQRYGTKQPPEYPLYKASAPCSLHYGEGDLFVAHTDVMQLKSQLKRVVGLFKVPYHRFNHADFLLALDADKLLYRQVLDLISMC